MLLGLLVKIIALSVAVIAKFEGCPHNIMEDKKSFVVIMEGKEVAPGDFPLLTLPHPKDGQGVLFMFKQNVFYELQSVQPRKFGAWLIDERVSSDPGFYIATKFDPKFLLLPFLEKSSKFSPLDQILTFCEGCDRIPIENHIQWGLDEVCDVNDKLGDDMILYRLNLEKLKSWLRNKVDRTARFLYRKRMKSLSSQVNTFNSSAQSEKCEELKSSNDSTVSDRACNDDTSLSFAEEDKLNALCILCDLLSDSMTKDLLEIYNVPLENLSTTNASSKKRKSDWEAALEVEKETLSYSGISTTDKSGTNSSKQAIGIATKTKKSTTSKLPPPVKGAGSIMSFFGKKSKE